MRPWQRLLVLVGVALSAILVAPAPADRNENPGVLPPHSRPHGLTYGEWGAAWWTWAVNADILPIIDPDGRYGHLNQSGPVWFLAGNFGGTSVRTVTVPAGKKLFFPLLNTLWWAPDDLPLGREIAFFLGLDPDEMTDEELIRLIANYREDQMESLSCTVDGVALRNLDGIDSPYRADSPAFRLEAVNGDPTVSDGYWIMLAPLRPGQHVIRFTAVKRAAPLAGGRFELEVTYHLTVTP